MRQRHQRILIDADKAVDPKITIDSLAIVVCLALCFFASSFDTTLISSTSPLIWQLGLATAVAFLLARLFRFVPLARAERHVLIVGTNAQARRVANMIKNQPAHGYRFAGFFDEADFEGLAKFLRHNVIDEVFLALPDATRSAAGQRVLELCQEQGITTRLPLTLSRELAPTSLSQWFFDIPVVTRQAETMTGARAMAKRILDIVVATTMLVALAPLLLVVATAIKLTSAGPIFFVQQRVGLGKRKFPLYKFRTMVADAEKQMAQLEPLNEAGGPVFKIAQDPRITPIGKFLRQTSIDELPQLVNVLRGNMSLVGPRPLPVRDVDGFEKDSHLRRFTVPPGLTCLWQIGGRSEVKFEEWMELDMEYIDDWSLWLDVKILAKTIPAVLKGTGAA